MPKVNLKKSTSIFFYSRGITIHKFLNLNNIVRKENINANSNVNGKKIEENMDKLINNSCKIKICLDIGHQCNRK